MSVSFSNSSGWVAWLATLSPWGGGEGSERTEGADATGEGDGGS